MKDEVNSTDRDAPEDLRTRTRRFALRIIRLYSVLPASPVAQTIGRQVLRSGTSVGAHYRESVRARSDAEIVSKWEVALQELEETSYWLELLVEAELFQAARLAELHREADELTAILTACVKKVKGHRS